MRRGWIVSCLLCVGCGGSIAPSPPTAPHTLPTVTVLSVDLPPSVAAPPSPTPTAQSTQPVAATVGASPSSAAPTTVRARVVSVIPAAGADIRAQPEPTARVIAHVPADEEVAVLDDSVAGSDGQSIWVAIAYGDSTGYLPREFVSAPYSPSLPTIGSDVS